MGIENGRQVEDKFLSTLSHELRTPLNVVLGWAELLRLRAHDPVFVVEGAQVLERNTRLLTSLVDELDKFRRRHEDELPKERAPLPPRDLLAQLKVLVVDEVADSRELSQIILESYGAEVSVAASASEALAIFEKWKPDLLLGNIMRHPTQPIEPIRLVRTVAQLAGRL